MTEQKKFYRLERSPLLESFFYALPKDFIQIHNVQFRSADATPFNDIICVCGHGRYWQIEEVSGEHFFVSPNMHPSLSISDALARAHIINEDLKAGMRLEDALPKAEEPIYYGVYTKTPKTALYQAINLSTLKPEELPKCYNLPKDRIF